MKKKLFCDIDNTVANHYPYYLRCIEKKQNINLLKIKPIKNSRSALNSLNKFYNIYFITCRKISDKKDTLIWLKKNKFIFKNVYFVKTDKSKLDLIIKKKGQIYIDELKYGYETKKPKIKTKLIKKIRQMKLNFFRFKNDWQNIRGKILDNINK